MRGYEIGPEMREAIQNCQCDQASIETQDAVASPERDSQVVGGYENKHALVQRRIGYAPVSSSRDLLDPPAGIGCRRSGNILMGVVRRGSKWAIRY